MYMGRVLKNFDLYMDKLRLYAEACELIVEYKDIDGDGIYLPSKRKIQLDKDLPESTEVATFLHELAHTMDDALHDPCTEKKLDRAYKAFYKDRASYDQKHLVIACETRAWTYARGIAKKIRIPLGKWFYEEEEEALKSYQESGNDEETREE